MVVTVGNGSRRRRSFDDAFDKEDDVRERHRHLPTKTGNGFRLGLNPWSMPVLTIGRVGMEWISSVEDEVA
jgi:hypothetical protein